MNPQRGEAEADKSCSQAQYADRVLERILAYVSQRDCNVMQKHDKDFLKFILKDRFFSVEDHLVGIGYAVVAGYYYLVTWVEAFKYLKVARVLAADAYGYAYRMGA